MQCWKTTVMLILNLLSSKCVWRGLSIFLRRPGYLGPLPSKSPPVRHCLTDRSCHAHRENDSICIVYWEERQGRGAGLGGWGSPAPQTEHLVHRPSPIQFVSSNFPPGTKANTRFSSSSSLSADLSACAGFDI